MARIKRMLSLILCFALVAGYIPAPVSAEEVSQQVQEEMEEPVAEVTEESVTEETEAPATEATEPETEATEEPVTEETTEPATEATEPAVEEEPQLEYAAQEPQNAAATNEGTCGDSLTWVFDETTGTLTISGTGEMNDFSGSNSPWYGLRSGIQTVIIEAGVTSIGDWAFYDCSSMAGVTLPEGVSSIGDHAFYNCNSLTNITLPEGVVSIDNSAFYYCTGLTSITLPEGLVSIGSNAFYNCSSLTSITLPDSLAIIDKDAFQSCSNLTDIYITNIAAWAEGYGSSDSHPINNGSRKINLYLAGEPIEELVIPEGITFIAYGAFRNFSTLTSVTLPEGLVSIGSYAFYDCDSLTSITLPDSLAIIDKDAFQSCSNLTDIYITNIAAWAEGYGSSAFHPINNGSRKINLYLAGEPIEALVIPEGITFVAYGAFRDCSSLTSITLPEGVTSIGNYAFNNCSNLTSIVIPEGVASIGVHAFEKCNSLTGITLPESLTEIVYDAFYNCNSLTDIYITNIAAWAEGYGNTDAHPLNRNQQINLYVNDIPVTNVVIPEGVTYIGYGAFRNISSLRRVTLPSSVTSVGYQAFYHCSGMTKITLAEGLTTIADYAFSGCISLQDVVIPEGVTGIGKNAFYGCEELETVDIPSSLTTIGEYAFQSCRRLESIALPEGITKIADGVFGDCTNLESVTLPDTLTSIGGYAFSGCSTLPAITLPKSITTIGNSAFSSCSGLTSITLPEGVTSIGNSVFSWCNNLSAVSLPDSLVSIGTSAFYNSGITSITIPKGISYIEEGTFQNCDSLETVSLPSGILEIGENAFAYCYKLTNINLPDSITDIGNYAFHNCDGLVSIVLPAGLTRLEENVFYSCSNLESVTLPKNLARIYKNAFQNCYKLTSMEFPASLTRLDATIFSGCSKLAQVIFTGNAPQFHATTFTGVTLDAYYPEDNATWTEDKLQNYGGTVTWLSGAPEATDPSEPQETVNFWIEIRVDGVGVTSKQFTLPANPDLQTIIDCAKTDPEFSAFFTNYSDYVIPNFSAIGAVIDFTSAGAPETTEPVPTMPPEEPEPTEATEPPEAIEPTETAILYIEVKTEDGTKIGSTLAMTDAVVGKTYDTYELFELVKLLSGDDFAAYEPVSGSVTIVSGNTNGVVVVVAEKPQPTIPPETEPEEVYALTFKYLDSDGNWISCVVDVKPGEDFPIPAIPVVSGKKFAGWVSNDGNKTELSSPWYVGMPTDYIATYVEDTNDGLVDLTIYAYYYVDGEYHHKTKLLTQQFVQDSLSNSMVTWLYGDGVSVVKSALAALEDAAGYLWDPKVFYDCAGDSVISEGDIMVADGNKAVYVKVVDKEAVNASVVLHVHTAQEAAIARTVTMPGYVIGDTVSAADVLTKVGEYYTGDNMTMSDLYDAVSWEDLLSGLEASGATAIKVDGDTVEIHVILTNAEAISPVIGTVKQNLNVRSEPSTTGAIVKELEAGTQVEILKTQTVMDVEWGLTADGWIVMAYVDLLEASGTCGENLTWEFYKSTGKLIISGTGDMDDYSVRSGRPWSGYAITQVVIRDGVTSIGAYAFNKNNNLADISMPKGMISIGAHAFDGCYGLTSVSMPEGTTSIGAFAFNECNNLTNVSMPEGIVSIGEKAFYGCDALTGIRIPGSVATIGTKALADCGSLQAIEVDDSNPYFTDSACGGLFSKDQTILYQIPAGIADSCAIPDTVTEICESAFEGCRNLTEILIPEGITTIGFSAFYNCSSLTAITLPVGITEISTSTFKNCTNLREITIPESVVSIGSGAFYDCLNLSVITFRGDAPTISAGSKITIKPFYNVKATAYYPADNATWTEEVMQDCGGTLTWVPYGQAVENRVSVSLAELNGQASVWIDGREYAVQTDGDMAYVDLPDGNAKTMMVYTYHVGDAADIHTQYPIGMKVWLLENTSGYYTAARTEAFDDILQYAGMSIRVFGQKGIRMITSIDQATKTALTSGGLEGYTLKEYGTVIAWDGYLTATKPLVLDASYAKYNYAYKQGIADPVFQYVGDRMQYTNVLVDFTNDQCKNDLAMRPYMILEHENGERITLYGGIVRRSIGYIAYQNRNVFEPGSDPYEYVWEIIRYVYGTKYDKEYIISWSPPAM